MRRYIKDDLKAQAVQDLLNKGEPVKAPSPPNIQSLDEDVSLDDISRRIVLALNRATKTLLENITCGDVSREVIGALKDCEAMVRELSKKEKEFLENASEEQLEKLLKK